MVILGFGCSDPDGKVRVEVRSGSFNVNGDDISIESGKGRGFTNDDPSDPNASWEVSVGRIGRLQEIRFWIRPAMVLDVSGSRITSYYDQSAIDTLVDAGGDEDHAMHPTGGASTGEEPIEMGEGGNGPVYTMVSGADWEDYDPLAWSMHREPCDEGECEMTIFGTFDAGNGQVAELNSLQVVLRGLLAPEAKESGPSSNDLAMSCQSGGICVFYEFELQSDYDNFVSECSTTYLGVGNQCPSSWASCVHSTDTRTSTTYVDGYLQSELDPICAEFQP